MRRILIPFVLPAVMVCGGGGVKGNGSEAARAGADGADPCALVSAADVAPYLGTLRHPPYRVDSEGAADPEGGACRYESLTGRRIIIAPTFSDARLAWGMLSIGARAVQQVITTDSGQTDTLDGNWDELKVMPGERLYALKGEAMVDVDVAGTKAGLLGATQLADIALRRLGQPLDYDGAAAARSAPGPLVARKDPCSLVTPDEAAQVLGELLAPPKSSTGACTYFIRNPLGALASGPKEVTLSVEWRDGFVSIARAKEAAASVISISDSASMAKSTCGINANGEMACIDSVLRMDTVQTRADAEMSKSATDRAMRDKLRGVLGSLGMATNEGSLRARTDTTSLKGPWDEAALLGGIAFIAVKKDVAISMDLQLLGLDKGKALVAKAMSRL